MAFLVIFKRFEVWLLLAILAFLLFAALTPEPGTDPGPPPTRSASSDPAASTEENPAGPAPTAPAPPFSLAAVRVDRSSGGWVVETEVRGGPQQDEVVDLGKVASATTENGAPVPRFFEPFPGEDLLRPGEAPVSLRWWLEKPAEVLLLEVAGHSLRAELP